MYIRRKYAGIVKKHPLYLYMNEMATLQQCIVAVIMS